MYEGDQFSRDQITRIVKTFLTQLPIGHYVMLNTLTSSYLHPDNTMDTPGHITPTFSTSIASPICGESAKVGRKNLCSIECS